MGNKDFNCSISVNKTPTEAFKAICKVTEWWSKNIEGETEKLNDVFTYRPGETWVTFKITEFIPNKKIVWYATDCFLHWQENKKEWKDTQVVFEISENGNTTKINFTHIGLMPEVECYEGCAKGWTQYIIGSLHKLLTDGKGNPG